MTTTKAQILTVSQLTNAIKLSLESTFPMVWLQGEISNFKHQSSGHFYFSLKDSNAQISAVMFRGDASNLSVLPKDGDNVIVRGELNVYAPRGNYQILIKELSYVGVGELLLKLEQLKIKLHKMGWFSSTRKKPLPKLPRRIGIVTSPTGAAIQDILNILGRRFSGVHLILNPVRVQGEEAAKEIAKAIDQFNEHDLADVLIVGRGGGSLEDLWAFNEEIVAEAIFKSRIPIISAVGHETDHCIADYVADVRAPTPSAAAELVIAEKAHHQQNIDQIRRRTHQALIHLVKQNRRRLEGIVRHPMLSSAYALLGESIQRLDNFRSDLDLFMSRTIEHKRMRLESQKKQMHALTPAAKLRNFRQKLTYFDKALNSTWNTLQVNRRQHFNVTQIQKKLNHYWTQKINLKRERLQRIESGLSASNPKNLLTRGYSILFSEKDNSVITSVRTIKKQQSIRFLLSDGTGTAIVEEVLPK